MDQSEIYDRHEEIFAPHLAAVVAKYRDGAGLTRTELAKRLGISMMSVVAWENLHSKIHVWQFYALAEALGFDASAELREIFASSSPPPDAPRTTNKRAQVLREFANLTERQRDALVGFLRAMKRGVVSVAVALFFFSSSALAATSEERDLSVSEAEGLWSRLREEGWLPLNDDKLVHVFIAETFVESRNMCLNYVIDVSARYMVDLWEIELATAIFFYNADVWGVIPERDNKGFVMTFLCRPNGYSEFSRGVSSRGFKRLLP